MAKLNLLTPNEDTPIVSAFDASDSFLYLQAPFLSETVSLNAACLFSYSSHRDKYPVTGMSPYVRGFTNGHRSVVGNVGFRSMPSTLVMDICQRYSEYMGLSGIARVTELPPVTLILVKYNTYLDWKTVVVSSCSFQDEGRVVQIDDITSVWMLSFQARDVVEDAGKDSSIGSSRTTIKPITTTTPTLSGTINSEDKKPLTELGNTSISGSTAYTNPLRIGSSVTDSLSPSGYSLESLSSVIGLNPELKGFTSLPMGGLVHIKGTYNNLETPAYSYYVPFSSKLSAYEYATTLIPELSVVESAVADYTRSSSYASLYAQRLAKIITTPGLISVTGSTVASSKSRADVVMSKVLDLFVDSPLQALSLFGDWPDFKSDTMSGTYYLDGDTFYIGTSETTNYFVTTPKSGKLNKSTITAQRSPFVSNNPYGSPYLFDPSVLTQEIGVLNFGKNCGYGYSKSSESGMVKELLRMYSPDEIYMYESYLLGKLSLADIAKSCKVSDPDVTSFSPVNGKRIESDFCYASFWLLLKASSYAGLKSYFAPEVTEIVPTMTSIKDVVTTLTRNLSKESIDYLDIVFEV